MNVLVTRGKLASRLLQKGYEPRIIPNPWTPGRIMWEFASCDDVILTIRNYYEEIGSALPNMYKMLLAKEESKNEEM